MDPSFLESSLATETAVKSGEGKRPPISPVELATLLVSGSDTCEKLGRRAFAFFEASSSREMLSCFCRSIACSAVCFSTDDVMYTDKPPCVV